MATVGGAQATKNKLERSAGVTPDTGGKSGADLAQAAKVKAALTTVGPGKDGAALEQMIATANFEVEAAD